VDLNTQPVHNSENAEEEANTKDKEEDVESDEKENEREWKSTQCLGKQTDT